MDMQRYLRTYSAGPISNARTWGNRSLSGLRATDAATDDFQWSQVPEWIKSIQLAANTQRLLDLNIQRAEQGLPPISAQSVAPTVNVGVSSEIQKLITYGGLALLVVMLIKKRG